MHKHPLRVHHAEEKCACKLCKFVFTLAEIFSNVALRPQRTTHLIVRYYELRPTDREIMHRGRGNYGPEGNPGQKPSGDSSPIHILPSHLHLLKNGHRIYAGSHAKTHHFYYGHTSVYSAGINGVSASMFFCCFFLAYFHDCHLRNNVFFFVIRGKSKTLV